VLLEEDGDILECKSSSEVDGLGNIKKYHGLERRGRRGRTEKKVGA
jgi:hypothetical protein